MRELFQEIWSSIRKNKLRTFLTGFSVAWGIFMLIILLGSGNGLENGTKSNFANMATNTIELHGGRTSMPYAGYEPGRDIQFSNEDVRLLEREFDEIGVISPSGYYAGGQLTYRHNFQNVNIRGVVPESQQINTVTILEGRYINQQDIIEHRKSLVISESTRDVLFGNEPPIGKTVLNGGITYTVVGIYKSSQYGNHAQCYLPISTAQMIYNYNKPWIGMLVFTVDGLVTDAQMDEFENDVYASLGRLHNFNPQDKSAIYLYNNHRQFKVMNNVFNGLSVFIWIIGLGTLMAGIVGVSNIMLVTVRERTFEFGIRKALGAKPSSIIRLILLESVVITSFFGYIGLVLGVGIMEIVNFFVQQNAATNPGSVSFFLNPTLNIGAAISATIVLIIAGVIAGYVPARRAAQLKTIDALRHNK